MERFSIAFSIGKVFGVPIRVHFSWFLIFALITWTLAVFFLPSQFPGLSFALYWALGAISALLLFISVLFHELAYTYVALKKGLPVSSITLFLFGGVFQLEVEPSDPKTEALMSVVGPLTSFAIAIICRSMGSNSFFKFRFSYRSATLLYCSSQYFAWCF